MENSKATPRQLWALYCITKKDYRNSNLTKEEAAKLISKLGSPDYKKVKKKTLSEELLDYLKENFDKIFSSAIESLNYRSVVEPDPLFSNDHRKYVFIGLNTNPLEPLKFASSNNRDDASQIRFAISDEISLTRSIWRSAGIE